MPKRFTNCSTSNSFLQSHRGQLFEEVRRYFADHEAVAERLQGDGTANMPLTRLAVPMMVVEGTHDRVFEIGDLPNAVGH